MDEKEKISEFFRRNPFLGIIIASAIISAIAGGTFGFYAAKYQQEGNSSFPSSLLKPRKAIDSTSPFYDSASGNQFIPATTEESKVVSLVKKSTPAVVSIVATKDLTIIEGGSFNPFQNFCDDPFFKQFLGNQCLSSPKQQPQQRTEKQQVSAGSGFLISSDGLILTNKHVINIDGASFTVIANDGKKYPAKILAKDPVQDLAVVKIDGFNFPYLPLGDSAKLQIGQTVVAIGNALGQFSNTVSKGVVSGLSRSVIAGDSAGGGNEKLDQLIQTDTAINPGNSGGPLLNLSGEVIGINSAIVQNAQNIGFAIPINRAQKDINQVKTTGKITSPFIGIRYVLVDENIKKENNLSVDYGALVIHGQKASEVAITPGSPADKAGIKDNDIILEINGKKINKDNDLITVLQNFNVGDTVTLKILSQGQEKLVKLTLTERKQ